MATADEGQETIEEAAIFSPLGIWKNSSLSRYDVVEIS
jgi:hypothetical protein